MSFDSPSKQQRIERHLMRQRGAGVRIVSANFGFDIGLSQQSTSIASSVQEEDPAKRSRTHSDTDEKILAHVGAQKAKGTTAKTSKLKRRFEVIEDEITRPAEREGEDSFVAGAKRKSKKRKVASTAAQRVDIAEGWAKKPNPPERPKRRAAAQAAERVANDLLEEKAPIDKKRRQDEPYDKPKRSVRKLSLESEPSIPVPDAEPSSHHRSDKASAATTKRKAGKRKTHRAKEDHPEPNNIPQLVHDEETTASKSTARRRPTRDRKARTRRTNTESGNNEHSTAAVEPTEGAREVAPDISFGLGSPQAPRLISRHAGVRKGDIISTDRSTTAAKLESQAARRKKDQAHLHSLAPSKTGSEAFKPGQTVGDDNTAYVPRRKAKQGQSSQRAALSAAPHDRSESVSLSTDRLPLQETNSNALRRSESPGKQRAKIPITRTSSPPLVAPHQSSPPIVSARRLQHKNHPRITDQIQPHPAFAVDHPPTKARSHGSGPSKTVPKASRVMSSSADPASRNIRQSKSQTSGFAANTAHALEPTLPSLRPTPNSVASAHFYEAGGEFRGMGRSFRRGESGDECTSVGRPNSPPTESLGKIENPKDEDLDWLNEAPVVPTQERHEGRKLNGTKARKAASGLCGSGTNKLPEIDLDDLISNIAKFAGKQGDVTRNYFARETTTTTSKSKSRKRKVI
jgi:hypothetical protein